jgi:hypothetical protein
VIVLNKMHIYELAMMNFGAPNLAEAQWQKQINIH